MLQAANTELFNPLVPKAHNSECQNVPFPLQINPLPLVPDAHYSERQDKPFSLQIQRLEVDLKLKCEFLFFAP